MQCQPDTGYRVFFFFFLEFKVTISCVAGNWNTGGPGNHASGNSMAAVVAPKTGVIHYQQRNSIPSFFKKKVK